MTTYSAKELAETGKTMLFVKLSTQRNHCSSFWMLLAVAYVFQL
jgi:hypothetical protein